MGHCRDESSINEKIPGLETLRDHGGDLSQEAARLIDVPGEGKRDIRKRDWCAQRSAAYQEYGLHDLQPPRHPSRSPPPHSPQPATWQKRPPQ